MITRLHVKNFRTLVDVDWQPHPKLSILVGPNNSGKTNLCYALRFLSLTAQGKRLDEAAVEAFGAATEAVCRWTDEPQFEFDIEGSAPSGDDLASFTVVLAVEPFRDPRRLGASLGVARASMNVDGRPAWERGPEGGSVLDDAQYVATGTERSYEIPAPRDRLSILGDVRPYGDTYPRLAEIAAHVAAVRYYRIESDNLRLEPEEADATLLADDGSNIAFVLKRLKEEDADAYDELIAMLRQIEPDIRDFEFVTPADGRVIAQARYSQISGPVSLKALSDGTLRYLALCVVAVQMRATSNAEAERPSVVMYEEPENGLYVRHLHPLIDRLKELSEHTQVIITTHSPFLLDFFGGSPECIFVVRRGEHGTEIGPADPERIDELRGYLSMGEMHYREVLA